MDNQRVSFSKQKDTQTVTVTTNPNTWLLDIFKYEVQQAGGDLGRVKVDPLLKQNTGSDINNIKISILVNGVKGLARSFEMNNMFGQGNLAKFASADDFLSQFVRRYEEKAMIDVQGKKRDKAETPQAMARAEEDKKKILSGLEMVKGLFAS